MEKPGKISFPFETLYPRGRVYIFPSLYNAKIKTNVWCKPCKPPDSGRWQDPALEIHTSSKTKLQLEVNLDIPESEKGKLKGNEAEVTVIKTVYAVLKECTREDDLPCFVLHNVRWKQGTKQRETDVLVFGFKIGVVILEVKGTENAEDKSPLEVAVRQLKADREEVKGKLKGLLGPKGMTLAIVLPNLTRDQEAAVRLRLEEIPGYDPDMKLVLGKDPSTFQELLQPRKPSSDIWCRDHPRLAFQTAAEEYLTAGRVGTPADTLRNIAESHRRWLLTREQMDVRDLQSKLLHIHGPPGAGKTILLLHRARHWLGEGKAVVVTTSSKDFDLLKAQMGRTLLNEQKEGVEKRIRICRHFKDLDQAVTELKRKQPSTPICLITDELYDAEAFRTVITAVKTHNIQHCWSADVNDLPRVDDWSANEGLEWKRVELPECIRCPPHVVDLLNRLLADFKPGRTIKAFEGPRPQSLEPPPVVNLSSHHDCITKQQGQDTQPDLKTTLETLRRCEECRRKVTEGLKLQSAKKKHWKEWVALCTGSDVYKGLRDLATWLEDLGVPSVCELDNATLGNAEIPAKVLASRLREPATTEVSLSAARPGAWKMFVGGAMQVAGWGGYVLGALLRRVVGARRMDALWRVLARWWYRVWAAFRDHVVAEWRERVVRGVSKSGQPAMHVVWHKYFRGLEKDGVLLIHWDQEDFAAREDQSDVTRERRSRHCREWTEAASRCQGQLVILLLSPSPAHVYLQLSSR